MTQVYGEPVDTVYFSCDSDITTVGIRAGTMATKGMSTREVEEKILARDQDTLEELDRSTEHIWWCFDSSPTCQDIEHELEAYAMVTGRYPSLIIVDNLMDISFRGLEERQGQDAVLDYLKQLATRTQAAMVVLCHVVASGRDVDSDGRQIFVDYSTGKHPIPLSGLMNKIDKRPRLVLTLYQHDVNVLGICVVKNNNGWRDAEGKNPVLVPWIQERMVFGK